jgi:hypothetical protein
MDHSNVFVFPEQERTGIVNKKKTLEPIHHRAVVGLGGHGASELLFVSAPLAPGRYAIVAAQCGTSSFQIGRGVRT